jgi:deoxycytidylate deaminase
MGASSTASTNLTSISTIGKKSDKDIVSAIQDRQSNELIIGLCGSIGSGVKALKNTLLQTLSDSGYKVVHVRVSHLIAEKSNSAIGGAAGYIRYKNLQDKGDELRLEYGCNILAACAIDFIATERRVQQSDNKLEDKIAYVVDQLKHPDEVKLFRLVYPHNFYLIGLIRTERERRLNLEEEGIKPEDIDDLIRRDRKGNDDHGQQVEKTLYNADYFIRNKHNQGQELTKAVDRFIRLIHGANGITPTHQEIGMFSAYAASLRSACLSRQVGAAIMDDNGRVISTGCNDVPEYNGGLYTTESKSDFRCVHRGHCANDKHKNILKEEIANILMGYFVDKSKRDEIAERITQKTKIKSLIEYSRAIHAEMDAILSLARQVSESTKGKVLYATTYPCHNCARHIVAAGITKVVYIEPYEKSLALKLHDDSISDSDESSKVIFSPFEGVSPNRFDKFFKSTSSRKDKDGKMIASIPMNSKHVDVQYLDGYPDYELKIVEMVADKFPHQAE